MIFPAILLVLAICVLLPGVLIMRRVAPGATAPEHWAVGGALAVLVLPYLAFVPAYAFRIFLGRGLVAVVAVAVLAMAAREVPAALRDWLGLRHATRRERSVIGLMALVGLVYFVKYDSSYQLFDAHRYLAGKQPHVCHHLLVFNLLASMNPGAETMRLHEANQSLPPPTNGNVAVYAYYLAALGFPGYRLLVGVVAALQVGLACVVVDRLLGRLGRTAGVLIALDPMLFGALLCDNSELAMLVAWLVLYFGLARRASGLLLGAILGLGASTGLRYLPATYGLAAAACLVSAPRWRRELPRMVAAFAVLAVPWATQLVLVGHTGPEPYVRRALGPMALSSPQFLNFPLGSAGLVSMPFIPLPTPLIYLFHELRNWGLALSAASFLGAMHLWRTRRRTLLVLVLLGAPALAVLSLQAYSIDSDRMFLSFNYTPSVVVAIVAGLAWISERMRPLRFVVWGFLCATLYLSAHFLGRVHFDYDPARRDDLYLDGLEPAYAEAKRPSLVSFGPLPELEPILSVFYIAMFRPHAVRIWDLTHPRIDPDSVAAWRSPPPLDPGPDAATLGAPVRVRLELSGPLIPGERDWYGLASRDDPPALPFPPEGVTLVREFPAGAGQSTDYRILIHRAGTGQVHVLKQSFVWDPYKSRPDQRPPAAAEWSGRTPPPAVLESYYVFDLYDFLYDFRDFFGTLHGLSPPGDLRRAATTHAQPDPGFGGARGLLVFEVPAGARLIVDELIVVGRLADGWYGYTTTFDVSERKLSIREEEIWR